MVELRQRESCGCCKALRQNETQSFCYLAYGTELREIDGIMKVCPKEPCPQPFLMNDLFVCEVMGYNKWVRVRRD